MEKEKKSLLIKYLVCFGVASLITVGVFWIKGFFTDSIGVNLQILSDGFFVSGILLLMFSGMMFVSSEGALLGVSFALRGVVQVFLPTLGQKHETYAQYRDRKLAEKQVHRPKDHSIVVVGLIFLTVSIVFTIIWYENFYNITG